MTVPLREVTSLLDDWYDPAWAEPWDAVGLVAGDPDQPVGRILLAVDPAPDVVDEAVAWGADLLLVHHPLLLTGVHSVAATTPKGRVVHRLGRAGTALFAAHTNADVAPRGVNEALARAVGIVDPQVVVATNRPRLDKVAVFVPEAHAKAVRDAMAAAGAGRLGDYDGCSFSVPGEGRFRPLAGADPAIGTVGEPEVVAETRVEVVLERSRRAEVVSALLAAHPYEEPAYDVVELANEAGPADRGHGRIGRLAEPTTLRGFVEQVEAALPRTAHGIRVAGDPERPVHSVVTGCGSGDFMLETVLGLDADVYLTSDLRHHRAGEFLEHDRASLVDVAHWAAEWTWLPVVERRLARALADRGTPVETRVSTLVTDPWTFRAGA